MPLNDTALRSAKPREKPYKLSDGGGLHVLVATTGSRLWRIAYRHGGKQKLLAIGSYPDVSLADARKLRDQAKGTLAAGMDPSVQRKLDQIAAASAAGNTFETIAEEFLKRGKTSGHAASTVKKHEWLLKSLAYPELGKRPIADISPAEVLAVLQPIERRGHLETARALRGKIGAVFRWAIATQRANNDPTYALKGAILPPTPVSRAAITDPRKLGHLLCAVDEYDGWPTITAAIKTLALTFVRPIEARFAEWPEMDLDGAKWTIPAHKTKMRRVHDVPLSRQAVAVLREIHRFSGRAKLVFPSIRSDKRPLSENAMNSALRRMGFTSEEHCSHGFRATASTILNERGFREDVIERQLAHLDPNEVRRAYNRAKYWPERVQLMQAWADMLDEFRTLR